jgi:hypothetical protein
LKRQSEYDADKGKGSDSICQGRKKNGEYAKNMVPARNNQQQEKKDNSYDLRREEER